LFTVLGMVYGTYTLTQLEHKLYPTLRHGRMYAFLCDVLSCVSRHLVMGWSPWRESYQYV